MSAPKRRAYRWPRDARDDSGLTGRRVRQVEPYLGELFGHLPQSAGGRWVAAGVRGLHYPRVSTGLERAIRAVELSAAYLRRDGGEQLRKSAGGRGLGEDAVTEPAE